MSVEPVKFATDFLSWAALQGEKGADSKFGRPNLLWSVMVSSVLAHGSDMLVLLCLCLSNLEDVESSHASRSDYLEWLGKQSSSSAHLHTEERKGPSMTSAVVTNTHNSRKMHIFCSPASQVGWCNSTPSTCCTVALKTRPWVKYFLEQTSSTLRKYFHKETQWHTHKPATLQEDAQACRTASW